MGRSLRSGNKTEFDPSLLGRAGRISKKDFNGDGVDANNDRRVTTRAKSEAEQHQEDRRQQARNKIPEAPPTPDRATLLLHEEKGQGRATRGTNPTCLHFGLYEDRCSRFPSHFFCDECKHWQEDYLTCDQKGRIKRSSKRYACQAGHTSWIHPTHLMSSKQHYLLVSDQFSDNDDEVELSSVADDEGSDDDFSAHVSINTSPPQHVTPSPVTTNMNLAPVSPDENAIIINRSITPTDSVPKFQYDILLTKYEKLVAIHQQLLLDQECQETLCLLAISPPSLRRDTEKKKKKRIATFISILMNRNYFNGGTFQEILKQSIQFLRDEVYSGKSSVDCYFIS
jgi:hypothetical protein